MKPDLQRLPQPWMTEGPAARVMRALNHLEENAGAGTILPAHLLVAMLEVQEGHAYEALAESGANPERVRCRLSGMIGG